MLRLIQLIIFNEINCPNSHLAVLRPSEINRENDHFADH